MFGLLLDITASGDFLFIVALGLFEPKTTIRYFRTVKYVVSVQTTSSVSDQTTSSVFAKFNLKIGQFLFSRVFLTP